MKDASSRLIEGAKRTGAQAKRGRQMLPPQAGATATPLAARIGQFLPRLERGIGQAFRRVIQGALVPAGAKLLSLFEPPPQIIPRYQAGKPVEFGRKIRLDEVEGGLITGSRIVEPGGGQDQP